MAHRTYRYFSHACRGLVVAIAVVLSAVGHLRADNHDVHIKEVMAGANGHSKIQFIVIEQEATGENLWGPQGGETQSRAMLVFFDAAGNETGIFKFPSNPPTGGSLLTLVATEEFKDLPGAPAPDVIIPPLLNTISGKVCFKSNPLNQPFPRNECLSYGTFTGNTELNEGNAVAAGTARASALAGEHGQPQTSGGHGPQRRFRVEHDADTEEHRRSDVHSFCGLAGRTG